ncbi:MAG TPA: glycosyltransferase family 2 protein [Longimicrobiales bacterium]|nr:glycosyltransferase family 2 protein [Longimicrobiales bacterium]
MIYICIPTHNEQQTVGVVLWKLRQVLTDYPRDYQLLVADDASTDKTRDVLEPYTRVLPLTVVRTERQQGHAACLEMLIREAARRSEYPKRDVIITLQADFSEEPDDLVPLLKRMEAGADVAVGIKVKKGSEPALRRFARRLSGFFARRQEWPEGVVTPFDGYRAYRLHSVKRAIEERGAERLLRYDGWAGHAELLRAVLPHARRVDVVEVEDRGDRRQRPSREKPLAAAMQVRAMMRDAAPTDLVPVEELDRMVAAAHRAREEAARAGNGTGNGRQAQQGGSGARAGRDRSRGEGRTRESRPRDGRARGEVQARSGRSRTGQGGGGQAGGSGDAPRRDRGQAGGPDRPRRQRQPRPAEAATPAEDQQQITSADATDAGVAGIAAGAADNPGHDATAGAGEGQQRKRRRRRRRRGGSGRGSEGGQQQAENAGTDAPDARDDASDGGAGGEGATGPEGEGQEAGGAGGGGEKKRRRRGGRRGGRRRRRRPDGSGDGESAAGEGGTGEADAGGQASGGGEAPDGATGGSDGGSDGPARGSTGGGERSANETTRT